MIPAGFLRALFSDLSTGHIEIRVIEETGKRQVVARCWYESIPRLLADLQRLSSLAERQGAGVFFGVLPRRERGKGTAADVLPGLVVWVDLDFKDFRGGEAEARKRLAEFPIPPSIIVVSGHGLHAYWRLREPADPTAIVPVCKGLAEALGGDHCFDAARILRLPWTVNRKFPDALVEVTIEKLDASHEVNFCDLEEIVGGLAPDEAPAGAGPAAGGEDINIGDAMSARVLALLDTNTRLRNLFCGHGKPGVGEDGRTLDASSSGYDFSFVTELAHKGIRDLSELATALAHRPDGAARAKGQAYLLRTIRNALARIEAAEAARQERSTAEADFTIESVRLYSSVPASYEVTINGKTLHLTSGALRSRNKFSLVFMDTLHRIPTLPAGEEWRGFVNALLARAELIEMPPDASEEPALREEIASIIDGLPTGEALTDLDHGKALVLEDGRKAFKAKPILKLLREDHADLKPSQLCRTLKAMGYESDTRHLACGTFRGWASP